MSKYTQSFKQQVIEFYLQNGKKLSLTRRHFQLAQTSLERWISQYKHNGLNGLAPRDTNSTYTPEFKLAVVQAVKNGQFSARNACFYFGIANSASICQWLKGFDEQGINGLTPKAKGHRSMKPKYPKMPPPPKTEEERLRYRILELEAEVAILKKWQELKQEKMQKKQRSSKP